MISKISEDKDICLKKYEIESLLKNFIIFFILQSILLGVIILQGYKQGKNRIDAGVKSEMKLCSYDLQCEGLVLDFVKKSEDTQVRKLYKEGDIYSYFDVPTESKFLLKVLLSQKIYETRIKALKEMIFYKFIWYFLLTAILSLLFSIYTLRPLQKALILNEEFVKDMLHDINTPLSSMIVNFKLFKKEIGKNRKIERIEHNIASILSLQKNLQTFLDDSQLQKETFLLPIMIKEQIAAFKAVYPAISFEEDIQILNLQTNKESMSRILDNLLSNACKYSPKDATISIYTAETTLYIQDNGKGIKNIKKVFDRYYKENERGMGIGMHIVKKLCDTLHIPIMIKSKLGKGTTVMLDLNQVMLR